MHSKSDGKQADWSGYGHKAQKIVRKNLTKSLGKDEVGGSNPPSSSNKYLKSSDFRCFFVANVDFFVWVKMWGSGLTHTVTHTRKGNNGHKSAGREDLPSRPGIFLSVLHDLFHEAAHGLGCLILLLPCCVGVGAEGETGVKVP